MDRATQDFLKMDRATLPFLIIDMRYGDPPPIHPTNKVFDNSCPIGQFQIYLEYLTTTTCLLQLANRLEADFQEKEDSLKRCYIEKTNDPALPENLINSGIFNEKYFMFEFQWLPLKLTKENLVMACKISDVVLSRNVSDGNHAYNGVSFGSQRESVNGNVMAIFAYVETFQDLLLHLNKHLQHRQNWLLETKSNVWFDLVCPMNQSKEQIKIFLRPIIGEDNPYDDVNRQKILILERPLLQESRG